MQRKDTNLDLIREKFEEIITALENKISTNDAIHSIENMIFRELLILGKLLFQYYLNGIFRKPKKTK